MRIYRNICKNKDCQKYALLGYKYCEDHIGEALKRQQEEKQKLADWHEEYANMYDD